MILTRLEEELLKSLGTLYKISDKSGSINNTFHEIICDVGRLFKNYSDLIFNHVYVVLSS